MTLRLVRLIALDWFDGPIDAVALSDASESLHCRLTGEPPISGASVYEFSRLHLSAFGELLSALESECGPASAPIWVPRVDASAASVDTLEPTAHLEPLDAQFGYAQTDSLLDQELNVVWVDAPVAQSPAGAVLWADVLRVERGFDNGA